MDIACGTGYGSASLARHAKSVVGVDLSSDSITYARTHYASDNVTFMQADATDSGVFRPATFDVVCSFETIEHLDEGQRAEFLTNLRKWLRPNGVLLMSTPNKSVTSPYTSKPLNPHHLIEFTLEGFRKEVAPQFVIEASYGQRLVPRLFVNAFVRKCVRGFEKIFKRDFHLYDLANGPTVLRFDASSHEPRVQVHVCRPRGGAMQETVVMGDRGKVDAGALETRRLRPFGRFEGARHPDFRGIRALDYDDYWRKRGFAVSGKLKQRERIFLE